MNLLKILYQKREHALDQYFLDRPGNIEIQHPLVEDYRTNVLLYPKFQEYFRRPAQHLAVWGKKDPYFLPAGAQVYQKDLPHAELKFYDTGHFALETNLAEIGADILAFMPTLPK